jgi:Transglycosylase SLT domain
LNRILWLTASGLLLLWSDPAASGLGGEPGICESHMIQSSRKEDVPLGVLFAVGLTETGRKGVLHPYALNVEGRTVFTGSAEEALAVLSAERRKGKKLIDLGCMQINHYYHGAEFSSAAAMLDPKTNVSYAAKFLRTLKEREGSWTMAVARYHAGPNNNPAQKRYICAVIRNLIATGFGNWTPSARKFCR